AWAYALLLVPLGALVLAAMVLNAPPLALAAIAGKRFPDAKNVIALWRMLVGIPAFFLWIAVVAAFSVLHGTPAVFAAYAIVTALGLAAYYRTKKLAVSVHNLVRGHGLRTQLLALHQMIDEAV